MFQTVVFGELCLLGLNCYSLTSFRHKDLYAAAAALVLYRVFFLWAFANQHKYCRALYGVFNSVYVARNLLLLGSICTYLLSRGVRITTVGEIYTGDSSISKFGLIALVSATAVRIVGVGWVMMGERLEGQKTNPWPAIALALPVIIFIFIAIVEHGFKGIFWLLLYDLMVFYGYGIFL